MQTISKMFMRQYILESISFIYLTVTIKWTALWKRMGMQILANANTYTNGYKVYYRWTHYSRRLAKKDAVER